MDRSQQRGQEQATASGQRSGEEEEDEGEDEQFEGDDLADAMSILDLSSLPPPTSFEERRSTEPAPVLGPIYPDLAPEYRSLNSIQGVGWDLLGTPSGTASVSTQKGPTRGSGKIAKGQKTGGNNSSGLSPDLARAIFGGITRRKGGKRFARLGMDDTGRWKVVRYSKLDEVFPRNAR